MAEDQKCRQAPLSGLLPHMQDAIRTNSYAHDKTTAWLRQHGAFFGHAVVRMQIFGPVAKHTSHFRIEPTPFLKRIRSRTRQIGDTSLAKPTKKGHGLRRRAQSDPGARLATGK